jgi:hypothetical protein
MRCWSLSDRPTLQELIEVQRLFGLPDPALVEKDWHVIKALAAIAAADIGMFRLVFGGGTALSRAHGLIRRMSEDLDLKIVAGETQSRSALRRLRENITACLLGAGFQSIPKMKDARCGSGDLGSEDMIMSFIIHSGLPPDRDPW